MTSTPGWWQATVDVAVLGSGVAGLTTALQANAAGLDTLVVTKDAIEASNTRWAQGGIAVVLPDRSRAPAAASDTDAVVRQLDDPPDSLERHVRDTLNAGGELCDPDATRSVVTDGPEAVRQLLAYGARFDTVRDLDGLAGDPAPAHARPDALREPPLARTREGGHTACRVIHAGGDATGTEVQRALADAARARGRDGGARLTVLEQHTAVELHRDEAAVRGVTVRGADGSVGLIGARTVVLATGGLGQLYHATTNPDVATADGIALALRAGATVADLEFVQFHPTVLFAGPSTGGRRPLVTEAVRGEGAVLLDGAGERVMTGVHPAADLAPRDVVSAAINERLLQNPGGVDDRVFLDATHLSADNFGERFPTVYAACRAAGIDPASEPIPVAPAAHFGCGGVLTDASGWTGIPGLYAVGEVARTGLHGANRLASNSLLEGLVMGTRAGRAAGTDGGHGGARRAVVASSEALGRQGLPRLARPDRAELQRTMSRYAGIGRDADGLRRITELWGTLDRTNAGPVESRTDVEDAALGLVAAALASAALERTESRGCHRRTDYPAVDPGWRRSVLVRLDESGTPVVDGTFDDEQGVPPGRRGMPLRYGESARAET